MSKKILASFDFNKNQILNGAFQALATAPSNPSNYQYYFDTTDNCLKYWNGTSWEQVGTKGAVVFKGTLGSSGTITALPLDKTGTVSGHGAVLGAEYMVIADGYYTVKTGVTKAALVGDLFVCTKEPTTSSATDAEWELVPSGNDKFKTTITGDGSTTEFTITHTLNTKDVSVSIYNSSDEEVLTDVTITAENTVTIGFAVAPATTDTYTVIILS